MTHEYIGLGALSDAGDITVGPLTYRSVGTSPYGLPVYKLVPPSPDFLISQNRTFIKPPVAGSSFTEWGGGYTPFVALAVQAQKAMSFMDENPHFGQSSTIVPGSAWNVDGSGATGYYVSIGGKQWIFVPPAGRENSGGAFKMNAAAISALPGAKPFSVPVNPAQDPTLLRNVSINGWLVPSGNISGGALRSLSNYTPGTGGGEALREGIKFAAEVAIPFTAVVAPELLMAAPLTEAAAPAATGAEEIMPGAYAASGGAPVEVASAAAAGGGGFALPTVTQIGTFAKTAVGIATAAKGAMSLAAKHGNAAQSLQQSAQQQSDAGNIMAAMQLQRQADQNALVARSYQAQGNDLLAPLEAAKVGGVPLTFIALVALALKLLFF